MTYFNTNAEEGDLLDESEKTVNDQESLILKLFKDDPEGLLAPHQVLEQVNLNVPITSIRRALTNLTDDGHLVKTDYMVRGGYQKSVHTWKLAERKAYQTFF